MTPDSTISGRIAILRPMPPLPFSLAFSLCALLTAPVLHAAVVTTADNDSPPGDGLTSLAEALTGLQDGETISFAIPGTGPHYILTPVSGYPLITRNGVTIDGYTQPGAAPDTAGPDEPKNAQLRIVLDSRTAEFAERRTVLDFPGFGTSESCVLGFQDAKNVTVRGLAFLSVSGQDADFDPHVYNIALLSESTGAKIQGCWFGLDPAMTSWAPGPDGVVPGVAGARSAVASFKWSGLSSSGLVFGTDGDGTGDAGEGNVCVAQRLAVHLETPDATVAGNWINVFPDGSFLNLETQALELEDGTMEAIENGDATNMRIGTNGDGISDALEGNRFGPIVYSVYAEFWRSALGIVFAGNSVGTGLDGLPAFTSAGQSLLLVRKNTTVRIGTDGNGQADPAEANHISGLDGSFLAWHGSNNDAGAKPARVSVRGNDFSANTVVIPVDPFGPVTPDYLFADALLDSSAPQVVLDPASTPVRISGTVPQPKSGVAAPVVDLCIADAFALYQGNPQGRSWLGGFLVDGPADLDPAPNQFTFDVSAAALSPAEAGRITASATYTLTDGTKVTTNFSDTLAAATPPPALGRADITRSGPDFTLTWTGGTAPYLVYRADSPSGPWTPLARATGTSLTISPPAAARGFYHVREGAAPR